MKLSVNILTWNTLRTLNETLAVLKDELSGIDSEVIIVDNGSTDGCEKLATIKNPVNLGISKAKNQGIDASKGEYILLIDGDVVPVPNSIRLLLEHLENSPEKDAIGFMPNKFSNQRNAGGQKHHEDFCHKLEPIMEHKGHCVYFGLYRKSVFERGVRFDEEYGVGYGWEDLDTYMQMERLGIKQWVAGINHLCGKYFHAINSSINNKNCLGFEEYMRSSFRRGKLFNQKWDEFIHARQIAAPAY